MTRLLSHWQVAGKQGAGASYDALPQLLHQLADSAAGSEYASTEVQPKAAALITEVFMGAWLELSASVDMPAEQRAVQQMIGAAGSMQQAT